MSPAEPARRWCAVIIVQGLRQHEVMGYLQINDSDRIDHRTILQNPDNDTTLHSSQATPEFRWHAYGMSVDSTILELQTAAKILFTHSAL